VIAEVEPSTPTPIAAPANDHTDVGELAAAPHAAPTIDVDALRERLLPVFAGENPTSQKAIAAAIDADPSIFSRWLKRERSLKPVQLDALERWLTEHERKVKPR
jgi:hypothetical protein